MTNDPEDKTAVKGTIMIVEGDGILQEAIIKWINLRYCGLDVLNASDYDSAISMAIAEHPQIVIIDIYLSLSFDKGVETVKKLIEISSKTKIVILTSHVSVVLRDTMQAIGVDALILKTDIQSHLIPALGKLITDIKD
ncbi:response regulator [Elusimicrobiota bacterium]